MPRLQCLLCQLFTLRLLCLLCLQELLPCAEYYKRSNFPLKKILQYASNRGYTDMLVFNEDHKAVGAKRWVVTLGA